MMVKEKKEIQPILVKFGVALALSFAGFLYSRLKTKRISPSKPPLPPRPQSPRVSDHGNESDSGGGEIVRCDIHSSSQAAPSCSRIASDKHEDTFVPKAAIDNFSPLSRESGDKERYLLPEFNELVKEINFSPRYAGISPKKENESPRSDSDTPKAFRRAEKEDYEQEIKHLRSMVRILREKERNLEVQLLEYYGLKEQETAVVELQNRLKINNMEAKLFSLKIESLQADNRRLEAQVSDHNKVVAELESAKVRMKILKKKLRSEAEQNKEQLLTLQKRVEKLQDYEHKKAGSNDLDGEFKAQRLNEMEMEVDELRKFNSRLQMENSELARRLESTQILASANLEDPDTNALKEMSHRLQKENEDFAKEVERLQADRCADVEELVYLRWINACLRFELRNYQPQSGKAVARDLSKTLSPKSEEKAKQLILKYATTEGLGENSINLTDVDSDQWSSSQASYLTDSGEFDESPADNTSSHKTSTSKFFSKLRRLIRGKESGTHHKQNLSVDKATTEETMASYSMDSPNFSSSILTGIDGQSSTRFTTPSQTSSRQSLDVQKIRRLNIEDSQRSSDVGSTFSYKRFVLGGEGTTDSSSLENQAYQDSESSHKSELVKYAEVLRGSRSSKPNLHTKSKSFSSC